MSQETIIERIRKLLRLGTSPNPHEAELAMSRAAEIAAKHKLDLGRIQVEQERPRADFLMVELSTRRPTLTHRMSAAVCCDFFYVEVIWQRSRLRLQACIVGLPQDMEIARHVFFFLQETVARHWTTFRAEWLQAVRTWEPQPDRRSWVLGFFSGLIRKLEQQRREFNAGLQSEPAARTGYELVLAKTREAIERAVAEIFPDAKDSSAPRLRPPKCLVSFQDGMQRGAETELRKVLVN
jgi:hypothetical protein